MYVRSGDASGGTVLDLLLIGTSSVSARLPRYFSRTRQQRELLPKLSCSTSPRFVFTTPSSFANAQSLIQSRRSSLRCNGLPMLYRNIRADSVELRRWPDQGRKLFHCCSSGASNHFSARRLPHSSPIHVFRKECPQASRQKLDQHNTSHFVPVSGTSMLAADG